MKKIKYLVMDVDGTLTDGKIYMGQNGEMLKAFNIKDGYGIHDIAMKKGIIPIIITGRTSSIVTNRCNELGIDKIYQGISNKISKLIEVCGDLSTVAYIGDDLNDLVCMQLVKEAGGLIGCPKGAVNKVIKVADYVAPHDGGAGAVRDFIEWIIDMEEYYENSSCNANKNE